MTDRIAATLAVIEAAKAFVGSNDHPSWVRAVEQISDAVEALASATSPDLDAKIAEVLPWSDGGRAAELRGAVRDLIVSLSTVGAEPYWWGICRGRQEGFEQAREQAAKIAETYTAGAMIASHIRSLTPDTERKG